MFKNTYKENLSFCRVGGTLEGPSWAQDGPSWAQDGPRSSQDGQDGRRPARGMRKMAQDTEDELEDAAQDRQDAVSERLRRAKMKKVVRRGPSRSVQVRFGVRPCGMRGPALDYVYDESEESDRVER